MSNVHVDWCSCAIMGRVVGGWVRGKRMWLEMGEHGWRWEGVARGIIRDGRVWL